MIFVFGSNLAGIHGAGAALYARINHGAVMGEGIGRTGNAYGIPTKDKKLVTLPLDRIRPFVDNFLQYARSFPTLQFNVTRIGCGLAGYRDRQIAPLFRGYPPNCVMPIEWEPYLVCDPEVPPTETP